MVYTNNINNEDLYNSDQAEPLGSKVDEIENVILKKINKSPEIFNKSPPEKPKKAAKKKEEAKTNLAQSSNQ